MYHVIRDDDGDIKLAYCSRRGTGACSQRYHKHLRTVFTIRYSTQKQKTLRLQKIITLPEGVHGTRFELIIRRKK